MIDLSQITDPAGRLDVAASRFVSRLFEKSQHPLFRHPVAQLIYQGLRADLDTFLNRHLGPGAIPVPDPEVLRTMVEAAIRMKTEGNRANPS